MAPSPQISHPQSTSHSPSASRVSTNFKIRIAGNQHSSWHDMASTNMQGRSTLRPKRPDLKFRRSLSPFTAPTPKPPPSDPYQSCDAPSSPPPEIPPSHKHAAPHPAHSASTKLSSRTQPAAQTAHTQPPAARQCPIPAHSALHITAAISLSSPPPSPKTPTRQSLHPSPQSSIAPASHQDSERTSPQSPRTALQIARRNNIPASTALPAGGRSSPCPRPAATAVHTPSALLVRLSRRHRQANTRRSASHPRVAAFSVPTASQSSSPLARSTSPPAAQTPSSQPPSASKYSAFGQSAPASS